MPRKTPSQAPFATLAVIVAALAVIVASMAGCAASTADGHSSPGANPEVASPAALQGVEWVVEDIDGRGMVDRSRATLNFAADGRVSGRASCNSYHASYAVERDSLTVSRAISTRMACEPALMQQEARFLSLLTSTRTFAIAPDGALTLRATDGGSIRARRATGAAAPAGTSR